MLNNLQVLRAVAAMMVVLAHLAGLGIPFAGQGIFGVDLFFVISGFVMVYTSRKGPTTPGRFIVNRLIRIVPLYWLLTIAVFIVALVAPRLLNNTDTNLLLLLKSLFFIAYEKHGGIVQPVLFPGWSLNYEMLFYVLFAVTLLLQDVRMRVSLILAMLCSLIAAGLIIQPADPVARFYTSTIQVEFGYGCLMALFHDRIRTCAPPSLILGLIGTVGFALIVTPGVASEGAERALLPGIPAAAIVYAAIALEGRGRRYEGSKLLLLGAASYSLYLSHVYVVLPIGMVAARFGMNTGAAALPFIIVALLLAVAVAVLIHLLLERPLSALLKGLIDPAHRREKRYAEALWPWRWPRSRPKASETLPET